MKLTERKVIDDIAVALGLDIDKNSTLECQRQEILEAIDRQAFFIECRDRENNFIRRKISSWRSVSKNYLKNPH